MPPETLPAIPSDRPLAVYTHAGLFAFWAAPVKVKKLLASGGFKPVGTKKKIRGLQAKSAAVCRAQVRTETERIRQAGIGDAHRRETYFNPRGVWTIDRLPESLKPLFTVVVDELKTAA